MIKKIMKLIFKEIFQKKQKKTKTKHSELLD